MVVALHDRLVGPRRKIFVPVQIVEHEQVKGDRIQTGAHFQNGGRDLRRRDQDDKRRCGLFAVVQDDLPPVDCCGNSFHKDSFQGRWKKSTIGSNPMLSYNGIAGLDASR